MNMHVHWEYSIDRSNKIAFDLMRNSIENKIDKYLGYTKSSDHGVWRAPSTKEIYAKSKNQMYDFIEHVEACRMVCMESDSHNTSMERESVY